MRRSKVFDRIGADFREFSVEIILIVSQRSFQKLFSLGYKLQHFSEVHLVFEAVLESVGSLVLKIVIGRYET